MPATKKTDNAFLKDKAALRASMISNLDNIVVLDAFGGLGRIWRAVGVMTEKKINRTAIDCRYDLDDVHLHGDNKKIINGMDLTRFNVVDLDAYGVPVDLIKAVVVDKKFCGIVFVTFIQTSMGVIPKTLARDIGLPDEITSLCPTLVSRRGWEFFKNWLSVIGIKKIIHRSHARKHYLGFVTGE